MAHHGTQNVLLARRKNGLEKKERENIKQQRRQFEEGGGKLNKMVREGLLRGDI